MKPTTHRTAPHRLPWPFLVLTFAAVVYFTYGRHYLWWINTLIAFGCVAVAYALDGANRYGKKIIAARRARDGSTGI